MIRQRKLIGFSQLRPEKGITDSRTTITRKMKKVPPQFPQCVRDSGGRRIKWFEDEIDDHVASLERGHADNHRANKKQKD